MNGERTDGEGTRWTSPGILVLIVVAIIGAVGVIGSAVIGNWPTSSTSDPSGEIVAPADDEMLSASFTAEGTLSDIPDGHHIWLAVQRGNEMFPKEPEIPAQDVAWVHEFVEAGAVEDGLSLVLLLVDEEGQGVIEEWIETGRREGFVGLPADLPGTRRLDAVSGLGVEATTTTTTSSPTTDPPSSTVGPTTTLPPATTTTTTTTTTTPSTTVLAEQADSVGSSEFEDALGDGQVMQRSDASREHTLLLVDGESAALRPEIAGGDAYEFMVRYSNDNFGPTETVTIAINGEVVGVFEADDTGGGGRGWNEFVTSPPLGPVQLGPGPIEVTATVTGGDGYGIELDVLLVG